ncbi:MAG: glycosyltransferase family 4 protein [Candidatus Uhrbacteria bacterium]
MRIFMIGQKAIPFTGEGGGIERHVEELAVRLVERGHEVTVYVRSRLSGGRKHYRGVRLVVLPSIPTKNLDTITHTFLTTVHVLFQQADVIHYHGVGPSTLAWIPRLCKRKTKIVVTFHSIDRFHKKWGWFARWYLGLGEWTACRFPHVTIVVSRALQQYCWHKFHRRATYIPNGVVLEKTGRSRDHRIQKFGLEQDQYILTVARLVRHKGIHYLIEAYKKLEQHYGTPSHWPGGRVKKLAIVGAPSYTKDYLEYLKTLAAGDSNIRFVGFQKGETLAQLFANAYLYVHPSEAEGLSTTILEAMSYGTGVLTSDIPENIESIDHAGYTFKTENVDDLYRKLVALLEDPDKLERRAEKGQQFVAKHFDWDEIVGEVENVYVG